MKAKWRCGCAILLVCMSLPAPMAAVPAEGASDNRAPLRIDPKAESILRETCGKISQAKAFMVREGRLIDRVLLKELWMPFLPNARIEMAVQRPDRLRVLVTGARDRRSFYTDGRTYTVMNLTEKTYATGPAPDSLDEVVERIQQKMGFRAPAMDFVMADPYKSMTKDATVGRYNGTIDLDGVTCHEIELEHPLANRKIYIAETDRLPRRVEFVVAFQNGTTARLASNFTDWNLSPSLEARDFIPEIPEGLLRIQLPAAQ